MAAAKKITARKSAARKTASRTENMKWAKVQLPDGYTAIASGDFGEEWLYEDEPVLEGIVQGDIREVEVGKGREKKSTRVLNVKTEGGQVYAVWDCAALKGFFDTVQSEDWVAIAFQGYRDVGRPQPMKIFSAGIYGRADVDANEKPARKASKRA